MTVRIQPIKKNVFVPRRRPIFNLLCLGHFMPFRYLIIEYSMESSEVEMTKEKYFLTVSHGVSSFSKLSHFSSLLKCWTERTCQIKKKRIMFARECPNLAHWEKRLHSKEKNYFQSLCPGHFLDMILCIEYDDDF